MTNTPRPFPRFQRLAHKLLLVVPYTGSTQCLPPKRPRADAAPQPTSSLLPRPRPPRVPPGEAKGQWSMGSMQRPPWLLCVGSAPHRGPAKRRQQQNEQGRGDRVGHQRAKVGAAARLDEGARLMDRRPLLVVLVVLPLPEAAGA